MPLAAPIALLLTDHTTRRASLTIGGMDVLLPSGTTGNQVGVPLSSITVDVASPGDVSSIGFKYEDPTGTGILPSDGDELQFWDRAADIPLFAGWVDDWDIEPAFGGVGRVITISGVGFEIILDWAILPVAVTIVAGTTLTAAIQSIAAQAEGTQGLRTFSSGQPLASQAGPVSRMGFVSSSPLAYDVAIAAGTSLREALRLVAQSAQAGLVDPYSTAYFTVDFYRGLRAMSATEVAQMSSDWTGLTVTDTYAGANVAAGLDHETDASQVVRGVFVAGANAAGTGLLMDGTGKPGRIAYISDSSIDTATKLLNAQTAYLGAFRTLKRGTFYLEDWAPGQTPAATITTGSVLTLTDAATGASGDFRIMAIRKTFSGSRETWRISYGGRRPTASNLIRRFTRSTRS